MFVINAIKAREMTDGVLDKSLTDVSNSIIKEAKEGKTFILAHSLTLSQETRLRDLGYTISHSLYNEIPYTISW